MNKPIVKAIKTKQGYHVQFKNNHDSKRNHVLEEKGITKLFKSETEAMEFARTQLPSWMFA